MGLDYNTYVLTTNIVPSDHTMVYNGMQVMANVNKPRTLVYWSRAAPFLPFQPILTRSTYCIRLGSLYGGHGGTRPESLGERRQERLTVM